MKLNISRLKKSEINWMAAHKCRHFKPYIEHPSCYLQEVTDNSRIGYFDIETSGFKADWSIMLCYCILDEKTDKISSQTLNKNDKNFDERIVRQCVKDIQSYDLIIGFYSTRFDLPFIRTRALIHGIDFPGYGALLHKDVYYMVRNKFALSRNRLENACRNLLGKTEKNHINPDIWLNALMKRDKKSLDYITDHCQRDVRDLKKLYHKIEDFSKRSEKSI